MTNASVMFEAAANETAVRGTVVKSRWMARLLTFLTVFGPGLIVMVADNDAGAVSTYTQAGAQYGLHLLWLVLLLLPITYFVQEMVVRLGIATGKGHAAMIYQRFGKWWGLFSLVDLEVVNFLTLVTEFACIDLALTKLGVNPKIGLPVAALGLIGMTMTGSYRRWERIVVALCALDLAWLFIAWRTSPGIGAVTNAIVAPSMPAGGMTPDYIFLVIAIVGTTIAPWQLFFQQSCIADKRLRFSDVPWARLDTLLGAVITIGVAVCMMLAGNAWRGMGLTFTDPAQMAMELGTMLGPVVRNAMLLMMVNAAVLGAAAISLSSAWAYGEVRGWPHSLQMPVGQARGFYAVYALCVGLAAAVVLVPGAPLQLIILGVQVLAGVMLPSAIIFLQLLLNDRELLGEYANKPWNNVVNWVVIGGLFVLSGVMAFGGAF